MHTLLIMSSLMVSLILTGLLFLAGLTLTVVMLKYPSGHENVTHVLGGGRTRGGKSQFERAAVLYLARRYPPGVVRLVLGRTIKINTQPCIEIFRWYRGSRFYGWVFISWQVPYRFC